MVSNILQMLFNAADSVVVGRFAGHASCRRGQYRQHHCSVRQSPDRSVRGRQCGHRPLPGTDGARPGDLPDAAHRRDLPRRRCCWVGWWGPCRRRGAAADVSPGRCAASGADLCPHLLPGDALYYAVQLRCCRAAGKGRHPAATAVSAVERGTEPGTEPVFCHCAGNERGGRSAGHGDQPGGQCRPDSALVVPGAGRLPLFLGAVVSGSAAPGGRLHESVSRPGSRPACSASPTSPYRGRSTPTAAW